MVEGEEEPSEDSAPLITMTTLGGSFLQYATPVKEALEKEGYEVAVFHSVSSSMQGAIMEKLIREGKVRGVLDLCPQGVLAEIAGGSCSQEGWKLHRKKASPRSLDLEGWDSFRLVP